MRFYNVYWFVGTVASGLVGGVYLLLRAWRDREEADFGIELALGLWCLAVGGLVGLAHFSLVPDALPAAVICLPAGVLLVLAGRHVWQGDAGEYPSEVEGRCVRLTEGPSGERWAEFSYEVDGRPLRAFCEDSVAAGTVKVGDTCLIHASATQPLSIRLSVRGSLAGGLAIALLGVALLAIPVLLVVL